ncbi:MAG: 16S rRNA (adenine(1518)-N(6)/adenine(1519)-N(6))-dimethyltransferase, partial [Dehalococcoidales bacterium]|nr:16S rRNA (adenine(1518)-N(6)/adenine(1519)-N(6))-dimethyltransferase [Dehalococcoidales bacterium]
AISVQFYGRPQVVTYVPAECFYPAPKVDSAVLRIDLYPEPAVKVKDADSFFRLVKAGFTSNRKQIANSLALGLELPKTDILPLLGKAGIDNKRRAETLSLEEWGKLYQTCAEAARC